MLEVLLLCLIIPDWINFLQLECYGHFGNNVIICFSGISSTGFLLAPVSVPFHIAIAFDQSHISKSDKCTSFFGPSD